MNYILVFTLLVLSLISCNKSENQTITKKEEISTQKDSIWNALKTRKQAITDLLVKSPKNTSLYSERAEINYQLGDSASTFNDISQAIELKNLDPELLYLKGYFAYNYHQFDTASFYLNKSHKNKSKNPEVPFHLGNIEVLNKKYDKALEWYDKAIILDDIPPYLHAKAFALRKLGKINEAIRYCELAIKKEPKFIKASNELVEIYINDLKDLNKAANINDKILKIDPHHPLANFNSGILFYTKAKEHVKNNKPVDAEGMFRMSIASYTDAIKYDPAFVQAYYNRGYCFFEMKEYDLAFQSFEHVTQNNPSDFRAWFMLGSISEYFDDKPKAISFYKKALEINPTFKEAQIAIESLK